MGNQGFPIPHPFFYNLFEKKQIILFLFYYFILLFYYFYFIINQRARFLHILPF
jgi:hypothetical protein